MSTILPQIASPADLHRLNDAQLTLLAQEIRDELVRVLSIRPAHFASNLGVEESRRRAERLGDDARAAVAPLGPAALRLTELVAYVLERDR